MLVGKFEEVERMAKIIDTRSRCGPAKMWEAERQSQSPAADVTFFGNDAEKNADTFSRIARSEGWSVRRTGPGSLYVDPDPGYKTHEELTKKPSTSF